MIDMDYGRSIFNGHGMARGGVWVSIFQWSSLLSSNTNYGFFLISLLFLNYFWSELRIKIREYNIVNIPITII